MRGDHFVLSCKFEAVLEASGKYTKQLDTAWERVRTLPELDLLGKWPARDVIQSRKESCTGLVEMKATAL